MSIAVVTPLAHYMPPFCYITMCHKMWRADTVPVVRLMNNMALLQQQLNTHAHTPRQYTVQRTVLVEPAHRP